MITFGSLFSGIGGFDLGFERSGMVCEWQCEIDKAAQTVLRKHFGKDVYNDVRTIGKDTKPVDLICGGFPCQDLSIAGKRKGLAGERSGLWFEFARIIDELSPRWVVIENVPGLLSSNGGRDFAVIIQWLVKRGYGVCWRVLDAQYFGVPQRRRRVFVVASLGNGNAAKVLFESEGLRGDPPARSEAGKETSRIAGTLSANRGGLDRPAGNANELDFCVPFTSSSHAEYQEGVGTLRANGGDLSGGSETLLSLSLNTRNQRNNFTDQTLIPTLSTSLGHHGWSIGDQDFNTLQPVGFTPRCTHLDPVENLSPTINTGGGGMGSPAIAWDRVQITSKQNGSIPSPDFVPPLNTAAQMMYGVRRLTPTECERLQGFPDGWTEGQADTQRYKQLGNAVAVPVVEWIGRRIMQVETDR